jgi:hypothetical protein
MTAGDAADARMAALDAYLAERTDDGYRVETRSSLQAVICRRHRLFFLLRWVAAGSAERRFVVSVDQHGQVTAAAAEPVRW